MRGNRDRIAFGALAVCAVGALVGLGWQLRERRPALRPFAVEPPSAMPAPAVPRLRAEAVASLPEPGGREQATASVPGPLPLPPVPPPLVAAAGAPVSAHGLEAERRGRFDRLLADQVDNLTRSTEQPELRAELASEFGRRRAGLLTLLALTDDESAMVRAAAVAALGQLGDPRAVDRLAERQAREKTPEVRAELSRVLTTLKRVALSPH